jgi:hypothetical protein
MRYSAGHGSSQRAHPSAVPRLGVGLPDRLAGAWIEQAGLSTVIVATVELDDLLD